MKNLKYIFTAICLIGLLSGCYKDDSTSFQIPLDGVSIAPHDNIPFFVGEISEYTPTVDWGETSQEDYDFKWTLNGREVISTDFTLKYTFETLGDTYLTFQMTNKKSGLVYGKEFLAKVAAKFFLGWVILSEGEDQSSKLSFVEMDSYTSHPDIYNTLFPGDPLGSKPLGLANTCISKEDQIMVLQEGGEGSVSLNGLSFKKVSYLKHEFIGEQYPTENFKPKFMLFSHRGTEMLITEDGTMYDRQNATSRTLGTAKFQDAFFSPLAFTHIAGDTKFTNHTFSGACMYFTSLYDELNRRWLAYHTTTSTQYAIPAFNPGSEKFEEGFNYCTGMAEDVRLVYAQSYNESTMNHMLINILERGGAYYINSAKLTLKTATYNITLSGLTQKNFATGYTPDENSKFCMLRSYYSSSKFKTDPHIFFNIGQKLYFYHWATDKTYLFRDFSKETNAPQGNIVSITQRSDANQIGVMFSDGHFFIMDNDITKLNAIRLNNLDPEQVDNGLVLAHIDDIPGKPVAVMFKCGKASNYTDSYVKP